MRIDDDLFALAAKVGVAALAKRAMIATAESCTGGLVAGALTAVAGSSDWFERGFITYSNEAKADQLAVPADVIERHGAVSEQAVTLMASGALRASRAQWAVAVTGIAGPTGGSSEKPVGTVWFAWASPAGVEARWFRLDGDRAEVRRESVRIALQGLLDRLA